MNITLVSGSHRPNSQSTKIAHYMARKLASMAQCDNADVLELADNPLPLWEETIWASDPEWQKRLAPLSAQLSASDAFVIVSPEWHGMAPAGLKNFFLMWGGGELAHKPALLVSVSAGEGGAYPIAELRMSSYKNNRICYMPEHLIVRHVSDVFNADSNDDEAQAYLEPRMDYCLQQLLCYGQAFQHIRASETTSLETYGNGM